MLVLSRKIGEKIHIGNQVTLTVVRIKGNQVRIGIEAPDDVAIVRAELRDFELDVPDSPCTQMAGGELCAADSR